MTSRAALLLAISLCACSGPPLSDTRAKAAVTDSPPTHDLVKTEALENFEMPVGVWKVVAVRAAPGPVQANSLDDPAYMGALLVVTPDRLSWRPHAGGDLSDVCVKPTLDRAHVVHCGSGAFGPDGTKLSLAGGLLTLPWYDGAVLRLSLVGQS